MKSVRHGCVYLRGSKKMLYARCIYEDNGKFFIKFYKQFIEVKYNELSGNWYTVLEY